jgi:hypothetical protein
MRVSAATRLVLLAATAAIAMPLGALAQDDGEYRNPTVGGLVLDGCYAWPGDCASDEQADAFCEQEGYDGAADWETENRGGIFTTKRLGDGGTCIASCTVMTYVECE